MSENTGPITNIVRNSAIPVSTWFGGDCCRPSALRTSDSTTMILVNEVQSSSTDGATDSTVIARIRVIELLGLPPPTETLTPPSPVAGAVGETGAVGAVGAAGAACAGPAISRTTTQAASVTSTTSAIRRQVKIGRRDAASVPVALTTAGPSSRAAR